MWKDSTERESQSKDVKKTERRKVPSIATPFKGLLSLHLRIGPFKCSLLE